MPFRPPWSDGEASKLARYSKRDESFVLIANRF